VRRKHHSHLTPRRTTPRRGVMRTRQQVTLGAFVLLGSLTPLSGYAARVASSRLFERSRRVDCSFSASSLAEPAPFEAKLKHFARTDELPDIRCQAAQVAAKLEDAVHDQDFVTAAMLRDDLQELRSRDPAELAASLRGELADRVRQERYADAARLRDQLLVLRRFQPQYQLAGLWKGNYPNHGEAIIRIHYEGETLFATKVTGDEHVPAGQVTFRADLTTPQQETETVYDLGGEDLVGVRVEVVSLSPEGSSEQREVERFQGEGRIAARGFQHAHFVPGQLFLMDTDVVGFLWLPLGTFVVFSRAEEEGERELLEHVDV